LRINVFYQTPTGRAIIQVDPLAENSIVLLKGANFASPSALPSDLTPYSLLVVQNEIPLEYTTDALRKAKSAGLQTMWNPSPVIGCNADSIPWDCVDWLILNEGEMEYPLLQKTYAISHQPDCLMPSTICVDKPILMLE